MPKLEQMVEELQFKHLKRSMKAAAGAGNNKLGSSSADRSSLTPSPVQLPPSMLPPARSGASFASFDEGAMDDDMGLVHPDFR
jgi:hypothetical protein